MLYRILLPQPRNPLARVLTAVVGALALLALIAFGVFALAALVVGGMVFMVINALRGPATRRSAPGPFEAQRQQDPDILEGEFTVISDERKAERQRQD